MLNTAEPNTPAPAPGRPRKKDRSYRLSAASARRYFFGTHPLMQHRRLDTAAPRPPRPWRRPARIAVCLSGRCCGLDRSYRQLQTNLLAPLGRYDLFMDVPAAVTKGE